MNASITSRGGRSPPGRKNVDALRAKCRALAAAPCFRALTASRAYGLQVLHSCVGRPLPQPCETHVLNDCVVQPILLAIDCIAAQRDGCSCTCSWSRRTARSRTSGEYLTCSPIAPIRPRNGACGNLEAVHLTDLTASTLSSRLNVGQDFAYLIRSAHSLVRKIRTFFRSAATGRRH